LKKFCEVNFALWALHENLTVEQTWRSMEESVRSYTTMVGVLANFSPNSWTIYTACMLHVSH